MVEDKVQQKAEPAPSDIAPTKVSYRARQLINALAAELSISLDIQPGETWRQTEAVEFLFGFKDAYPEQWAAFVRAARQLREEKRNGNKFG